jgi:hypothetical protein
MNSPPYLAAFSLSVIPPFPREICRQDEKCFLLYIFNLRLVLFIYTLLIEDILNSNEMFVYNLMSSDINDIMLFYL